MKRKSRQLLIFTNSAVIDIAVKFIPFWIIHEYGNKEVCVEVDIKAKAKYQVYKVWIKN